MLDWTSGSERFQLLFVDGEACVGHVAAGVHEGNHFCGILFEGILGEFITVVHEGSQVLEQRNFLANLLKFCRTEMAGLAKDIGGSFGLSTSTVIELKGVQVILMTAETPSAEVVFGQMTWEADLAAMDAIDII